MMSRSRNTVHGTGEWAVTNINIQRGCEHDCRYCYAKAMALRFGRCTPASWAAPIVDMRKVGKGYGKRPGTIMFPSSHDITPRNMDECVTVLGKLLAPGNDVLIVSKPHLDCIVRLCEELDRYRDHILFRFTIGSTDDAVLQFWEPGAPSFTERLAALQCAHGHGFRTSVSCEPMLDGNADGLVRAVQPYVTDSIWLGRANRLGHIVALTCPGDAEVRARADQLFSRWDDVALIMLYRRLKDNPMIRWKDSIKMVVGLGRPTQRGMDI